MKRFSLGSKQFRENLTWRSFLAVTVAALTGVAFGRTVIGTVCVVNGPSMAPTYEPGAHLLTFPVMTPIRRSDLVILDDGNDKYAVKRVIGLPGETVQIWRGHVYVNRRLLIEPYLPKRTYTCPVDGRRVGETLVAKEGQYIVLGDNRTCSTDSRIYGPVDEDQIKRRVPLPEGFTRASLGEYVPPTSAPLLHRGHVARLDIARPVPGRPALGL